MKCDTISRIAYLSGKYQFLADSCTSTKKKKAYSEICNDLLDLLELARANEAEQNEKFYKDLKQHISRIE